MAVGVLINKALAVKIFVTMASGMEKYLNVFNKIISYVLLATGMLFTVFQTLELAWEIFKGFKAHFAEAGMDYVPDYFKNVAVLFFNILLLLEILETVRVFKEAHEIKVKVILIVCLIAVSRKVLVMDAHESNPLAELSIAALVLVFSFSYFLVKRQEDRSTHK